MALSCATAADVLETIKAENVQMIDLRFTDLPGVWQHFSVPPSAVDADAFDAGIGVGGAAQRKRAGHHTPPQKRKSTTCSCTPTRRRGAMRSRLPCP